MALIDDIIKSFNDFKPRNQDLDYVFCDVSQVDQPYPEWAIPRQQFIEWLRNEAPTATFRTVEIVNTTSLNIRQSPVPTAKIVGKLYKGAKVTIDQELNGFYSLAGGWGWIGKAYTK